MNGGFQGIRTFRPAAGRPGPAYAAFVTAALVTIAVSGQGTAFVHVGTIAGPADLVEAEGDYAYVASGKTLTIVDVHDPATPKRAGSYTFPELIWGVTLAGNTAYVAVDTAGLAMLDIANPLAPVLRATLKTPGQAKAVAIGSNAAYVADHVRGIDVVTLPSPASPVLAGSQFVDGFAKDVVTRGNLLYALDQPSGLTIFDTTSGPMAQVGALTLGMPIPLRAQLVVSDATAGTRLAVVVGGGPLQIYDVTDPRKPHAVTTYRTPGNAQRVQMKGTDLYVADGPSGLQVVNLAMPSIPAITASFTTPMPARDVAASGRLVFVASGDSVLILRRAP
jgi:hypothetical protein